MTTLDDVLVDLAAESQQLDGWVAGLAAPEWDTLTTSEGWTVAHQVAHLHWTDQMSLLAIEDPQEFGRQLKAAQEDTFVDAAADELAATGGEQLLPAWREGRADLDAALRAVPDGEKIAWFGPPMSATSMATARVMETWAHGHDVADALGLDVPRTDRVRHVCHIGIRARGFAHLVRGEQDPGVDVRVELTAPSGEGWTWGPDDAAEQVTGSAWDFALLATRRRHRDDLDVRATGDHADHWLDIAQAFAGQPGADPVRLEDR